MSRKKTWIFFPKAKKQKTINKKIADAFNDEYVECKSEDDELTTEEYFAKIRPYLRDKINDLKNSGNCEIHLTIKLNFTSSKDSDYKRMMHSKKVIMSSLVAEELRTF